LLNNNSNSKNIETEKSKDESLNKLSDSQTTNASSAKVVELTSSLDQEEVFNQDSQNSNSIIPDQNLERHSTQLNKNNSKLNQDNRYV